MLKFKLSQVLITSILLLFTLGQTAQGLTYQELQNYYQQSQGQAPSLTGNTGQVLGASTIAFVSDQKNSVNTYGTSMSAAYPAPNIAGDLLVISTFTIGSSATVSYADSLGNAAQTATTYYNSTNASRFTVFYVPNCKGGSNTVTITVSGSSSSSLFISEFSGVDTVSPLDQTTSAGGYAGSPSASFTTTASGDLLYGASWIGNGGLGTGTGFFVINGSGSSSTNMGEYQIQTTAGPATVQFANSAAGGVWSVVGVAFKPSSGSSSGTPPVISSIQSSGLTSSSATITWTTDINSDSQVDYGTSNSYGSSSALNSTLTTSHAVSLSSLSPSTTYHYRVKSSSNGNLAVSSDNTFTTAAASGDTTAPSVPTGLTASAVSSSAINLSWTASTDNVGVTGYKVYRGGSQIGTSGSTSYSDTSLSASTNYSYTVSAYDAAGNNSSQSSSASATTQAASSGGGYATGWTDLANTHLQSVAPPNNYQPSGGGMPAFNFSDNFYGIVAEWSSGVADTSRNRLVIWGGGHVIYTGNDVYAVNLNSTPSVVQITPPSIYSPTCSPPESNADGTPIARHTYGGLTYVPTVDKMFAWEGANYCDTSGMYHTWMFNMATKVWMDMMPSGYAITSDSSDGARCSFDPNTGTQGSVICEWGNWTMLLRYDVALNTWTKLTNIYTFYNQEGIAVSSVIDPVRKLMIFMGDMYTANINNPGAPLVLAVDISSGSTFATQDWTSQVTGCSGMGVDFPGLAYDSATGLIVGYPGKGNTVYVFNPDTKTCTSQTFTGGPAATAHSSITGTFGRFQYFPSLDVFATVNGVDDDAYIFKLSGSGTPPPPDTTPPTVSVTAPTSGATVSGTASISATASDNVGVASVQFQLDGSNLGSAITTAPYSYSWDTTTASNGSHAITAIAKDAAGNTTTSVVVTVTVSNVVVPPPAVGANLNGLGGSTLTCLDQDGDGYGVGPGCLGPDADDSDPTVHTAAQGISKYGTLLAFLQHLGYNPTNIYYVAPGGSDTGNPPNCKNNINAPCATYAYLRTHFVPGDMVLLRNGWNGRIDGIGGSAGSPNVIMSYPGELATIDQSVVSGAQVNLEDISNLTIDGLKVQNTSGIVGGTTNVLSPSDSQNIVLRHIEGIGGGSQGLGTIAAFNGVNNWTIEDNVFHDDTSQHCLYLGSHGLPSSNDIIRQNICYNSSWNGFHFNGQMTNLQVDQNVIYNVGIAGISLQQGVSNSFFRDNVILQSASEAIDLNDYDSGECSNISGDGTGGICPHDQTGNLFENNTLYQTGNDFENGGSTGSSCPTGIADCTQYDILTANTAPGQIGNQGYNTFRNNIIVNYGWANRRNQISFLNGNGDYTCSTACQNWAFTDVFDHNIFFHADGNGGNNILYLNGLYTAASSSAVTTMTNAVVADPKFVSASINFWNNLSQFNFALQPSSPAVAAGTSVGAPTYDIIGNSFNTPPSIGAYEYGSTGGGGGPSDTTPPSVPTGLTASAVSASQINLSWTASTDNVGVTGYKIYRNGALIGSSASNSYSDTGLAPSTSYSYTVNAYDAAGNNSAQSSAASATTPALLPAISNLLGSNTTATSTTISWQTNVNTNGQVFYSLTTGYGSQSPLLDNSPKTTAHSYQLTNLTPVTLYHFKVTSIDALNNSTSSPDFTFTTLSASSSPATSTPPSSGGGGGGGGSSGGGGGSGSSGTPENPITIYIPPAPIPLPSQSSPAGNSGIAMHLINSHGTFYLVIDNILHGITNPGMLYSYGFSFQDAKLATAADLALPQGSLLTPQDGSLVKSQQDQTVYLISNQTRYAFTSASVFLSLGFKFSSVLVVTNPELQILPQGANLNNPAAAHLPGLDINKNGTIYWIGGDNELHGYSSLPIYNSWHLQNDLTRVVPANAADNALPIGNLVLGRVVE